MPAPKLSVIVATTEPWPEARACLEALDAEVDAAGGEVVLADGHGAGGPPAGFALRSPLRSAGRAGASVFELRSLALEQAEGEVVAITEDHCVAQPGWARAVLDAHAARPDADAVAGPVVNGSPDRLIDWANFLSTFAEFLPPVERRPGFRVPPGSNISYKRRVLPTGRAATGWLEYDLAHRLLREGRLEFDDHPRVAHVQEHGLIGTPLAFFHNGRTTVGLNQERPRRRALARALLERRRLPGVLVNQTRMALACKPALPRRARASMPLVALLACAYTAGECAALVAGPGRSPAKLN